MSIYAFLFITIAMQAHCPSFVHQATLLTIDAPHRLIRKIQHPVATAAFHQRVTVHRTPSTVSGIHEPIAALDAPPVTWEESWVRVQRAVNSFGVDHAHKALDTLDPLTRMCVAFIGYEELCQSSRISDTKAYYARVFRLFKKRADLSVQPYIPAADVDC